MKTTMLLVAWLVVGAAAQCNVTDAEVKCPFHIDILHLREVLYMVPEGEPPALGWPVMIQFHGWNMGGRKDWEAKSNARSGIFYKVQTKAELLRKGYAVIAPDSNWFRDGGYWETNIPPYTTADLDEWYESPDHHFMVDLREGISNGRYGKLDDSKVHAMGFSSGGFMTSRMGFNYAKEYRSLSIVSAGFAWCDGHWCPDYNEPQPNAALAAHPPTLFLHGSNDRTCRPEYAETYYNRLHALNRQTKISMEAIGHRWPASSMTEILAWVQAHN